MLIYVTHVNKMQDRLAGKIGEDVIKWTGIEL